MAPGLVWTLGVWSAELDSWVPIVTAPDARVVHELAEALRGASVSALVVSSRDDDDAIACAFAGVPFADGAQFNPHGRGSPEAD